MTHLLFCALCLVLTGCPQTLMDRVEKILPPPGYKPRFNTSSVSLDSLAKRYEMSLAGGTVDSSAWFDDSAVKDSAMTESATLPSVTSPTAALPAQHVRDSSVRNGATGKGAAVARAMRTFNETVVHLPKEQQDLARKLMMIAMMNRSVPSDTLRTKSMRLFQSLPDSTRSRLLEDLERVRAAAGTMSSSRDGAQSALTNDSLSASPFDTQSGSRSAATPSSKVVTRVAPARAQMRSLIDAHYPEYIELNIALNDSTGRAILGCAPPYLRKGSDVRKYWYALRDSCNGKAEIISDFSVEEVRESSTDPYALAFVIDHSGSMGNTRIRKLREAVRSTLGIIGANDMVTVMPFAGSSGVDISLTGDTALMRSTMDVEKHADVKPGTAIYDATLHAIRELSAAPQDKKKAILMFTDGEDGSSKSKLNDAIRTARESGVAVYTIAYGLTNEEPLLALAQKTGGQFYRIYTTREFPLVFQDIYRSLKNYYRIRYTPPPCAGIHSVRAEIRLPEIGVKRLAVPGTYDKSLFTDLDTVGSITFLNIEFAVGSADIAQSSMSDIDEMAQALRAHPKTVMEIRGHTDDRGQPALNERLSQQRADAVATALRSRGVQASQLRTKGFGSSQPLVPNTSDDNRAKNRRTEFVIIAQ